MDQGLLILIAPPNLEEIMMDLLLEQAALAGFTTSNVSAHGANSTKLSLTEQVTGRQQKVQFMVYGDCVELQNSLNILKEKLANTELRYILIPAIESQMI